MISEVIYASCGLLVNKDNYQKIVIINCGRRTVASDVLPKVQFWNLATNQILEGVDDKYDCPYVPSNDDGNTPVDEDGRFKTLNENYLVYTNVRDNYTQTRGQLYFFTIKDGFISGITNADMNDNYGGDSFVAPRGTVKCATMDEHIEEAKCNKGEYQVDESTCEGINNEKVLTLRYKYIIYI